MFVFDKEDGKRKCQITEVIQLTGVRIARSYYNSNVICSRKVLTTGLVLCQEEGANS